MDPSEFWNYEPVYFAHLKREHPDLYEDAEADFRAQEEAQRHWLQFISQLEDYLQNYPPGAE